MLSIISSRIEVPQTNIAEQKELFLLKRFYLENRIIQTHLMKKLLTLTWASYYQQSVLIVLYFQVDLSHSEIFQYLLCHSSLVLLFTLFSSYLVFITISYFKSKCNCHLAWIQLYICKFYVCSFLIFVRYHCKTIESSWIFHSLIPGDYPLWNNWGQSSRRLLLLFVNAFLVTSLI